MEPTYIPSTNDLKIVHHVQLNTFKVTKAISLLNAVQKILVGIFSKKNLILKYMFERNNSVENFLLE
jgi:hypothetical protein